MAQLKDLLVSGAARFTNGVLVNGTSSMNDTNPATTNTYSLGSDSLKWKNVYATTFTGDLSGNATSATKVNKALIVGSKTFDGSAAVTIVPADLGLANAMHFIGVATVAITDGSTTDPVISGYSTKVAGDVIIDKDSSYEYVWTSAGKWERLGGDGSYKITQSKVDSGTAETNKWVSRVEQDENGNVTITMGILDTSGTWDGNAVTASRANINTTTNAIAKYADENGTFANSGVIIDANDNVIVPNSVYLNTSATRSATNQSLFINNWQAVTGYDSYLRLNSENKFTNGVYTPGNMRIDGTTTVKITLNHANTKVVTDGSWVTEASGTAGNGTTAGDLGKNVLYLGNNIAQDTAETSSGTGNGTTTGLNNAKGYLRIYGAKTGYGELTYNDSMFQSNKSIYLSNNTTTGISNEIRGVMATNDYWRIAGGATASNAGYLEIATADDANEPIYIRQYSGTFTTQNTTLTLLDAYHDTYIPGDEFLSGGLYINSTPTTYNANSTYAVGDRVFYNGSTYRCTTAISTAEAWTASHWTEETYKLFVTGDSFLKGNVYIPTGNAIYSVGSQANYSMIRFIDNTSDTYGNGISIGGGGVVVIGSGESANVISPAGGTETTYMFSDGTIYLESNANSNSGADRVGFQIDASGHLLPVKAEAKNTNVQNIGAADDYLANIYTSFLHANQGGSGTTGGVTLYSGDKSYAIFFRQTASFGNLYNTTSQSFGISSDWATYFTMSDSTTRGWLFRRGSSNVAGITGNGTYLSAVSTSTHIQGNQGKVIIDSTASAGYNMLYRMKSSNGVFTGGAYNTAFNVYYTADSVISAGTNKASKGITLIDESGHLSPLLNNKQNLGYASYKWANAYITTTHGSLDGNASSADKVNNNFVIKISSGTSEGTNLYTFNGSAAKTINIIAGTGISLTAGASSLTINHSNSVTAKTSYASTSTTANANGGTIVVTDIKYDATGHVTASQDRTINLYQTTYTLAGLMGSAAIGSNGYPIYWTGSAFSQMNSVAVADLAYKIQVLSADPTSPAVGQIWVRTT